MRNMISMPVSFRDIFRDVALGQFHATSKLIKHKINYDVTSFLYCKHSVIFTIFASWKFANKLHQSIFQEGFGTNV